MELTAFEIKQASQNPDVLRALAHEHDGQETMADAIDDFEKAASFHARRAAELRAEATRIDAEA
jgi:hypothetical protein